MIVEVPKVTKAEYDDWLAWTEVLPKRVFSGNHIQRGNSNRPNKLQLNITRFFDKVTLISAKFELFDRPIYAIMSFVTRRALSTLIPPKVSVRAALEILFFC